MSFTKYPNSQPFYLLVLMIAIFIMIDSWSWITNSDNASTISALSTVVIAGLTAFLVYDTRKTRIAMHEQAIRPLVNLSTTEGKYCLENFGTGTAVHLKITLSDPIDLEGMDSVHGRHLLEYVERNVKENTDFNQTILSLGPNQKVTGTLFKSIQYYEEGLLKKLRDEQNLEYDPNQGIHIWNYKAKVTTEFENIDGKEYKSISYFDLSKFKEFAVPSKESEYTRAKKYHVNNRS